MKSSRFLVVAVLAIASLATLADAAVITLTATSYGGGGRYGSYAANAIPGFQATSMDFFTYDISTVLAMPGSSGFTAAIVYKRPSYTDGIGGASSPATINIGREITLNPATSTWSSVINTNGSNLTLFKSQTDIVSRTETLEGQANYTGFHHADVTSIFQAWVAGAANLGVAIDLNNASVSANMYTSGTGFVPTLEITTPEPATMGLLLVGGIATLLRRRRTA